MEETTMRRVALAGMGLVAIAGMVIAYAVSTTAMATDYKAGSLAISGP
jgi:hypothetical protein